MNNRHWITTAVLVLLLGLLIIAPASAQRDVAIIFSHVFTDRVRSGFIDDLIAEYNATHSGVTVTAQTANNYEDNLNGAVLASLQGGAPHIVQVSGDYLWEAVDSNIFVPLQDIASREQFASLRGDILAQTTIRYTFNDTLWALPFNTSSPILYYNVDIFAEAGLSSSPETFDEVTAACAVIMNGRRSLDGCISWGVSGWYVEQWLAEQGATLLNNNNGRSGDATLVLMTSDAMQNTFRWWGQLINQGWFAYTGRTADLTGSLEAFASGRVAMHISSSSNLPIVMDQAGFNVGTGFLPIPDGTQRNGVIAGGAGLWFTSGHSDAEYQAAVDFGLYLTSTANGAAWHRATGDFPIRESAIGQLQDDGWFDRNPAYRLAFDQLLNTQASAATAGAALANLPDLYAIIEAAAQSMIENGTAPQDALLQALDRAGQLMARR